MRCLKLKDEETVSINLLAVPIKQIKSLREFWKGAEGREILAEKKNKEICKR